MSGDRTAERNELIEHGLTYESAERVIDDRDYADWVSRGKPKDGTDHVAHGHDKYPRGTPDGAIRGFEPK